MRIHKLAHQTATKSKEGANYRYLFLIAPNKQPLNVTMDDLQFFCFLCPCEKIDTTIEQNLFDPRHDLTQLLNLGKVIPNIAKFSKHYQFQQHSSINIDS